MSEYQLPEVWCWENETDSRSGNRPDAGARFEQTLPVGDAPFQLYSLGTPNGIKITMLFEELKALGRDVTYDLYQINIGEGDQFGSDFVNINPNSKIPALVDNSSGGRIRIFESGSILLYLAEKFDAFLPQNTKEKTEVMNWLFWQVGAGPYIGGGFGHFYQYAPEPMKYPIDRFTMETKRQLDLLNQVLSERPYIAGEDYTIADMAIWPWYGRLVLGDLYSQKDAARFVDAQAYPHLMAWAEKIKQRETVKAALEVDYQAI